MALFCKTEVQMNNGLIIPARHLPCELTGRWKVISTDGDHVVKFEVKYEFDDRDIKYTAHRVWLIFTETHHKMVPVRRLATEWLEADDIFEEYEYINTCGG